METASKHIELLYDEVKVFTESSLELYKLNAIEITSDIVSSLLSRFVMVLIFSLFTMFVNIAISLLIGNIMGAYYLGFLIVSCFYLIITSLLYFFNNRLIKIHIANLVIEKLMRSRKKKI